MVDSLCMPSDDGGGIIPDPADKDPFVAIVPVLLIILPLDCRKGPEDSIVWETVRKCGRGDKIPSVSRLSFAADESAYSGSAGGLRLSMMAADTGIGFPPPNAAPEPCASRRATLELARRRRDLKRETNGEADCG